MTVPNTKRYDGGIRNATMWVQAHCPQAAPIAPELVRGVATILWPHLVMAATADLSDSLAAQFPDMAAALDRAVAERLVELTAKGPQ